MRLSKVGSTWSKSGSSEGWLTVAEAAGYLKVSRDFVYRAAERAEMPATKIGRQWRFRRDWLDDWLTAKRRGPAATLSAASLHPLAGGHSIARDSLPAGGVAAPAAVATSLLAPPWRLALDEFVQEVRRLYGPRLRKVLLYGSRARGDADADSDVDVAVVLDDFDSFWTESHRLSGLAYDVDLKYEEILSPVPVRERDYQTSDNLFYENLRVEGVAWP